jgi:hypothetical protein
MERAFSDIVSRIQRKIRRESEIVSTGTTQNGPDFSGPVSC